MLLAWQVCGLPETPLDFLLYMKDEANHLKFFLSYVRRITASALVPSETIYIRSVYPFRFSPLPCVIRTRQVPHKCLSIKLLFISSLDNMGKSILAFTGLSPWQCNIPKAFFVESCWHTPSLVSKGYSIASQGL